MPSKRLNLKDAISFIQKNHCLLVYPLKNKKEIPSLWSCFFPRKKMIWDWTEESGNEVADLWYLRTQLSETTKVVYGKWFQGRATFFSREFFTQLLAAFGSPHRAYPSGRPEMAKILDALNENSPLSTKALKAETDLKGKFFESAYHKALKELWDRLYIVGHGEVDDGAFPSLAIGSTQLLFEDLWKKARDLDSDMAKKSLPNYLGPDSAFHSYFLKILNHTKQTQVRNI